MTTMLARFAATLALAVACLPAQVQQTEAAGKFILLAGNSASVMEKKLNEAGARGYRFSGIEEGKTDDGGNEVVAIMTLDPDGRRFRYMLLAASDASSMQTELDRAPPEYGFAGITAFESASGGRESAVILEAEGPAGRERPGQGASRPESTGAGGSDRSAAGPDASEHVKVDKDNIIFLYESRAELRASDEDLAGKGFSEYANARDEFSRHDILQRVKPIIARRLAEAASTRRVYLEVGTRIGSYDFDRKSFPTGFSEGTFIPFHHRTYAVTFANAADIKYVPVDMASARSLARKLQRNRRGAARIYGDIDGASERTLNFSVKKTLSVIVTKIELLSPSGALIGTKRLAGSR